MKILPTLLILPLSAAVLATTVFLTASEPTPAAAAPEPRSAEFAVAIGSLVDNPTSAASIEEGIAIGNALVKHYGIEGLSPTAARAEAAKRAKVEIEAIAFEEAAVSAKATALGYDLEACGELCADVRNLAVAELRKDALVAMSREPLAVR